MNHKKNLATVLALLMAVQNSGQPWSVMAYEEETNTETVQGDSDAVNEVTEEPVIVEEEETPVADTETAEPVVDENPEADPEAQPAFEQMSTDGTYKANVNVTNNEEANIEPVTVDMGVVAEKISLNGYTFSNAMVNGKEVKAVRTWNDKKFVQYVDGSVEELTGTITVNVEAEAVKEETPAKEEKAEAPAATRVPETKDAEPEAAYYEVKFYDQVVVDGELQKAETPITTQWIKAGEMAVAPGTDTPEGYAFTGWSQDVNGAITENTEFVAQYIKVADAITLRIEYYYEGTSTMVAQPWVATVQPGSFSEKVTFPEVEGCKTIVDGEETASYVFDSPEDSTVIRVYYRGEDTEYRVDHVLLKSDGTVRRTYQTDNKTGGINTPTTAEAIDIPGYTVKAVNQVSIKKEGTVATVTYAPKAYTITYITGDGGSYVAPVSAYTDEEIPTLENPKRLGYEFKRWDYSLGDGQTMPAGDVTATAVWEAVEEAGYTINYWQENVAGDGYELAQNSAGNADVKVGTGNVGDKINYEKQNDRYTGFHLNNEKSAGDVTITADGQAVKNVYYDRTEYTIRFYDVDYFLIFPVA